MLEQDFHRRVLNINLEILPTLLTASKWHRQDLRLDLPASCVSNDTRTYSPSTVFRTRSMQLLYLVILGFLT